MSWGPRTSGESSNSPPKTQTQRSVSPLQRSGVAPVRVATASEANVKRSVSPLSRATSSAAAIGRAMKAASAVSAIARSASPRSQQLVGDWTDPKKLREIAKDLQRQLQRKESDAARLTDRVQKLVALRDEQLAESQAERKRLHYALEQEEVEVAFVMLCIVSGESIVSYCFALRK